MATGEEDHAGGGGRARQRGLGGVHRGAHAPGHPGGVRGWGGERGGIERGKWRDEEREREEGMEGRKRRERARMREGERQR